MGKINLENIQVVDTDLRISHPSRCHPLPRKPCKKFFLSYQVSSAEGSNQEWDHVTPTICKFPGNPRKM